MKNKIKNNNNHKIKMINKIRKKKLKNKIKIKLKQNNFKKKLPFYNENLILQQK